MIKVIIFDIGGVVGEASLYEIIEEVRAMLGVEKDEYYRVFEREHDALLFGDLSLGDFYKKVIDELAVKKHNASEALEMHLLKKREMSMAPRQEIVELIKELKQSYKVVALSNTEIEVAQLNRQNGIYDMFDKVYLSVDLHMRKPNPGIYKYVLNDLNVKAKEVVFVDDLEENINSAQELGIKSILCKSPEQIEHELHILLAS